jgi:hypothetical protein
MNSYSVDSDESMKRDDEVLSASSLQFFRSIKLHRFISTSFYSVFIPPNFFEAQVKQSSCLKNVLRTSEIRISRRIRKNFWVSKNSGTGEDVR